MDLQREVPMIDTFIQHDTLLPFGLIDGLNGFSCTLYFTFSISLVSIAVHTCVIVTPSLLIKLDDLAQTVRALCGPDIPGEIQR